MERKKFAREENGYTKVNVVPNKGMDELIDL